MVGLVLRFWPEYVELHRRVVVGRARPAAVARRVPALAACRLGRLVRGRVAVRRAAGRPDGARLRPDELAARRAAAACTRRRRRRRGGLAGSRRRGRRLRRRAGGRGGEHVHAGELPLLEPDPRQRARAAPPSTRFRAAPAEGGGNIGAVDPSARGLRLFPRGGDPDVGAHGPRSTRGARRSRSSSSCVEAGRQPEQRHRRAGAPGAARLAGRQPLARERQAGGRVWRACTSGSSAGSTRLRDETVALIQELVRVNSINPDVPRRSREPTCSAARRA